MSKVTQAQKSRRRWRLYMIPVVVKYETSWGPQSAAITPVRLTYRLVHVFRGSGWAIVPPGRKG